MASTAYKNDEKVGPETSPTASACIYDEKSWFRDFT
jgi:hypothetical protein